MSFFIEYNTFSVPKINLLVNREIPKEFLWKYWMSFKNDIVFYSMTFFFDQYAFLVVKVGEYF